MSTAVAGFVLLTKKLTVWRSGGVAPGLTGIFVPVRPEPGGGQSGMMRLAGIWGRPCISRFDSLRFDHGPFAEPYRQARCHPFCFLVVSIAGSLATLARGWTRPDGQTLALLVMAECFGGVADITLF